MDALRRFAVALGALPLAMVGTVARAEPRPPVIWYRSSEGCPAGEAFLARLRGAAAGARLAEVTDRIDFVVTLGQSGSRSSGKLERQTVGSTVAIREIEAENCEAVADVLALTLTLSLDPAAATSAEGSVEPGSAPTASPAVTSPAPADPRSPASRSDSARTEVDEASRPEQPSSRSLEPLLLLGGEVGPQTGPTGALGTWAGLFLELRPRSSVLPRLSTRLTGFYSRSEDESTRVAFLTAGGRLEGCPVAFGSAAFEVRPCLAFELGLAKGERLTSTGQADVGAWFAANGFGRFSWRVARPVALFLDAGAYAPIIRYAFASESGANSQQADPIGVFAALGVALVLL